MQQSCIGKITISLEGKNIELWLDKQETMINGELHFLDVPAQAIDGNTTVPIRFIAEALGLQIDYDVKTRYIFITGN